MTESTHNTLAQPSMGTVLDTQLRLVGWARRWTFVAIGAMLALLYGAILYYHFAGTVDTTPMVILGGPQAGPGALSMVALIAVFWALTVWHDESPARRFYHWSMPVARGAHERYRVMAGALWLAIGIAAWLLLTIATTVATGHGSTVIDVPGTVWLNYFTGPLMVYLVAVIAPLRSEHPVAWLLGAWFASWAVPMLLDRLLQLDGALAEAVMRFAEGPIGPLWALGGGILSTGVPNSPAWLPAALLWLGLAGGAVYAATLRPSDA